MFPLQIFLLNGQNLRSQIFGKNYTGLVFTEEKWVSTNVFLLPLNPLDQKLIYSFWSHTKPSVLNPGTHKLVTSKPGLPLDGSRVKIWTHFSSCHWARLYQCVCVHVWCVHVCVALSCWVGDWHYGEGERARPDPVDETQSTAVTSHGQIPLRKWKHLGSTCRQVASVMMQSQWH